MRSVGNHHARCRRHAFERTGLANAHQLARRQLARPIPLRALDFINDALYGGRRFRTLNVLDEGHREGLAIEVGTSIPAARVVRVLDQLVALHGRPQALRLDKGPELISSCPRRKCSSSPMRGSSPATSTGPTTRWVGYRRSRTWRASQRVQSPPMRVRSKNARA